jgi:hypothetical protein
MNPQGHTYGLSAIEDAGFAGSSGIAQILHDAAQVRITRLRDLRGALQADILEAAKTMYQIRANLIDNNRMRDATTILDRIQSVSDLFTVRVNECISDRAVRVNDFSTGC